MIFLKLHGKIIKGKARIKPFLKADNQGTTGYFQSPPAPKRVPEHPFFISTFNFP